VEVTMEVRTEMFNVRRSGAREYLPVGLLPLPGIFAAASAVHFVFLGAWLYVCVKHCRTAERIHAVMGALLLFKALKLACAAEDQWYVERTGTPHGWDVAFYVFGFFKGILLFTVIVLIGTGWSFLKPYLQVHARAPHAIRRSIDAMNDQSTNRETDHRVWACRSARRTC